MSHAIHLVLLSFFRPLPGRAGAKVPADDSFWRVLFRQGRHFGLRLLPIPAVKGRAAGKHLSLSRVWPVRGRRIRLDALRAVQSRPGVRGPRPNRNAGLLALVVGATAHCHGSAERDAEEAVHLRPCRAGGGHLRAGRPAVRLPRDLRAEPLFGRRRRRGLRRRHRDGLLDGPRAGRLHVRLFDRLSGLHAVGPHAPAVGGAGGKGTSIAVGGPGWNLLRRGGHSHVRFPGVGAAGSGGSVDRRLDRGAVFYADRAPRPRGGSYRRCALRLRVSRRDFGRAEPLRRSGGGEHAISWRCRGPAAPAGADRLPLSGPGDRHRDATECPYLDAHSVIVGRGAASRGGTWWSLARSGTSWSGPRSSASSSP